MQLLICAFVFAYAKNLVSSQCSSFVDLVCCEEIICLLKEIITSQSLGYELLRAEDKPSDGIGAMTKSHLTMAKAPISYAENTVQSDQHL